MANPNHLRLLRQGFDVSNARRENLTAEPRLKPANLSGSNLQRAGLCGANTFDADLNKAALRGADLRRAMLIATTS